MTEGTEGSHDGDDLGALIGEGPLAFPEETERKFQPWHRPRKQYVRSFQWSREVGILARDLKITDTFRYLTLPGNDLLDIRHLASSVCAGRGLNLQYLGFNVASSRSGADQTELNSAQFSTNKIEGVHPQSEVFPGDFRAVGNPLSVPWQRVRRGGPFHAINIDLCGGFAEPETANGIPNYFTALQALLQNQASSNEDFLLFITTRMDDNSIATEAREALNQVAQAIYNTCEGYAAAFSSAWGLAGETGLVSSPQRVGAADSFMLGLTQWIVSRGVKLGLKASVRSFLSYRTGSGVGDDDIVSLAIRFKPDPYIAADTQGLVKPLGGDASLDARECQQSEKIPSLVRDRILVDEILRTQGEKFERCMVESSDLLASAGYDATAYRAWVMQEADRYGTG